MTKDDLIQMADLVGYDVDDDDDVYAPAEGRYGLDPRLEHFAQLVAGYALRYECRDVSTKSQNSDTSAERVHETDTFIHETWDTSDMAHRSGGLTVEQAEKESTLQEISDIGQEIEQEPVARFNWNEAKFEWLTEYSYEKHHMKPLYLAPLKREWVGLTMQDIDDVTGEVGFGYIDVSFAIEAKLKEKNN
jgi:hypothetical protein